MQYGINTFVFNFVSNDLVVFVVSGNHSIAKQVEFFEKYVFSFWRSVTYFVKICVCVLFSACLLHCVSEFKVCWISVMLFLMKIKQNCARLVTIMLFFFSHIKMCHHAILRDFFLVSPSFRLRVCIKWTH